MTLWPEVVFSQFMVFFQSFDKKKTEFVLPVVHSQCSGMVVVDSVEVEVQAVLQPPRLPH